MKISGNEIRVGMLLEYKNDLWLVLKTQHVKPGKGGAFAQVEMKGLIKNTKLNERFRSSETIEKAAIEEIKYNFLYSDENSYYFMDPVNFNQVDLNKNLIGEKGPMLSENLEVTINFYNDKALSVSLPNQITCRIKSTDASIKGQTVSSSYKPAILENGISIQVPPFIENEDEVIIDTRTMEYVKKKIMNSISPNMNVMIKACEKASKVIIRDFGELENLQVSKKGPKDFVTITDKRVEKILIEELTKSKRNFSFITEETGKILNNNKEVFWIIDPIDGTTNFLHGVPHFAISIALQKEGEIQSGIIFDPIKNEIFYAEKNSGSFFNNNRVRVSNKTSIEDCLFATNCDGIKSVYPKLNLRNTGCAALDLAYVGCGRFDGYFHDKINLWDIAAGKIIVEEAGGKVNNIENFKFNNIDIRAANPNIYEKMLKNLKNF